MQENNASNANFRRNLSAALEKIGWNQSQLAEAASVRPGNISNYLSGRREPTGIQLFNIAKALGVSVEWLLTGDATAHHQASVALPKKSTNALKKALRKAQEGLDELKAELDQKK